MEVVILAGGLGTRLRSAIGNAIPKCMAPVAGKPFLWYLLKYLSGYDVSRVVLSVGHLRECIFDWIDQNKLEFPFAIDYAIEETPLGTGGGIKLALDKTLGNDVVVLNGDTVFNFDLHAFSQRHAQAHATISIALKEKEQFSRYGRVVTDARNRVVSFLEKQYCEKGFINGGVYLIDKSRITWPDQAVFSFEKEVLEPYANGQELYAFPFGAYFIDIGIPEDYALANEELTNIICS